MNKKFHLEYREKYWNDFLHGFFKKDVRERVGRSKKCLHYLEGLYFGEPLDPAEKSIQKFLENGGQIYFPFLLQNQDEAIWTDFYTRVVDVWGYGEICTILKKFKPMTYRLLFDPLRYGWTGQQDLGHFHFWWGDKYISDGFQFMGSDYKNPFSAVEVCSELAIGINMVLRGVRHYQCRYLNLYDYWKSTIDMLDERIFYPESCYRDECFQNKTDAQKLQLANAKGDVANVLKELSYNEVTRESYVNKLDVINGDNIPLRPYGMEKLYFEEFREVPELVLFRKKLSDDIADGTLPESIKALSQWASYPESDSVDLKRSTETVRPYIDPGKITNKSKSEPARKHFEKSATEQQSNTASHGQIPEDLLMSAIPVLERHRKVLLALERLEDKSSDIDITTVRQQIELAGYSNDAVTEFLKQLQFIDDSVEFLQLINPDSFIGIRREPFAAFSESEVNEVYHTVWSEIASMTAAHCIVESIDVKHKKINDEKYNITTSIQLADEKIKYRYKLRGSEIDEALFDNIDDFAERGNLPWGFQFDEHTSESEVFVYYVPDGVFNAHGLIDLD